MRYGFDRAHRVLSKTVVEPTWSNLWANPDVFYMILDGFLAFFSSILGFAPRWKGLRRKKRSAFDRARRALSWSNVGLIWSNVWANPFEKYSNPDRRYPTYGKLKSSLHSTCNFEIRIGFRFSFIYLNL